MPKKLKASRISAALNNISDWRSSAKSQGATHLFPMLALLERGAGNPPQTPVIMNETPHEFEFWDKYFRLSDGNDTKPYFNPVTLRRAEAGFPHSNSATIRKNTFAGKWNAAERSNVSDGEEWKLADDYADIFRQKVLSKGDAVARIPVVDVAALMFRNETFVDDSNAKSLETRFRERFPLRDEDYEKLFVFRAEDPEQLFAPQEENHDYEAAILKALVEDVKAAPKVSQSDQKFEELDLDDPILTQVQKLLLLGTSGIILTGVPGTGKSFYAKKIADHLVDDPFQDVFKVQLHPSYGYEDFVEGYRPHEESNSGFKIVDKTFVIACERAKSIGSENKFVALIVDEINRGDPARVFGEILTYIERSYRDDEFTLPFSGRKFSVPSNLVIIGTMNPFDRSIAQVDAAFVRRFDHIEVPPSRETAELLLEQSSDFSTERIALVGEWFENAQRLVPYGLGHSFFADVKDVEHLKLVWRYRIRPSAEQAIELDDGAIGNLSASFEALLRRLEGVIGDE